MGYATCRSCNGSGRYYDPRSGKNFDCRACDGTGSNKKLYETRCQRCSTSIIFPTERETPRFCKDCRNIELEKRCGQYGCNNAIRYKVGRDTVPTYCKRCETKRAQYYTASTCPGLGFFSCGQLIWSPPGKSFKLCNECGEKDRAAKAAQTKTKRCNNCGAEIRYNVEWKNVPDLCNSCREAEKAKWREKPCAKCGTTIKYRVDWEKVPNICKSCKDAEKAKWNEKPCSKCGATIKYNVDWTNIPNICNNCKQQYQSKPHQNKNTPEEVFWDRYKALPGSDRSIADLGCTGGKVKIFADGSKHVTVWNGEGKEAERYSYDVDRNGNFVQDSAHYTDSMAQVLSKMGHKRY